MAPEILRSDGKKEERLIGRYARFGEFARRRLQGNLLLHFSTVSFVIMAVIAAVLATVLSDKIRSDAHDALVAEAVGHASGRVLTAITPGDLEAPMTGARYRRFDEFVRRSIVSERTARVKLWATDGTVIYSDDPSGVGRRFPGNAPLLRALRGENAVEIQRPEEPEHMLERHLGALMEVYTPIIFPGAAAPQGVLEIYQHYGPVAQRINDLRRWIIGSTGAGLVVLYAGLVWIVWRGSRTINRQQVALARTNADLRAANEELHRAQNRMALALSETKTRARKLWALADLSRRVTATLDPDQVFSLSIRASSELLDSPVACVWALEAEELILRGGRGLHSPLPVNRQVRLGEGIVGWVAQHRGPVIITDLITDPRAEDETWALAEGLRAFAGFPLLAGSRCMGVLTVARHSSQPFGPDEVALLSTFADQAAVALENARLYEQLKEMTVLEERERIAREMHDGLAQQLSYLHLKIGELEMAISSEPAPFLREELHRVKKVAAATYGELRHAIFGLRMMVSRGLGLIPTLTEYLHEFSTESGITVELKVADESATRVSAHAEVQLIRIIQEALANVRKHAHAKRAWVILDTDGGEAKITVEDDGRGFDPREATRLSQASFGLQSMRDRAELVGGMSAVDSRQGTGTRVIVRLPIEE